jgi:hypothetical protein
LRQGDRAQALVGEEHPADPDHGGEDMDEVQQFDRHGRLLKGWSVS